ncbi:MAG: amino acid adenylation domain-containing protein [Rhodocyclaceae bacterium]|nr:amino acid adenylation domain-containing protein [Rhodocyclaceae bacterium]MBX3669633.1 amino acid adenylation domain-containing protein [Rhodocyclaceae bacterium]
MSASRPLHAAFVAAAAAYPDRTAVVEPGRASITYAGLERLSDRLRDHLLVCGVRPGDRVGIYMRKSIDAVAAIYGILKAGAAYVPVDPGAPPARNAYIMSNCAVHSVLVEARVAERFRAELEALGAAVPLLETGECGGGEALSALLEALDSAGPAPVAENVWPGADALAYILYTSGSTGKPKGVMLSHENAVSFVDWCSETFSPTHTDRFSSHAPFHFDLSILDIHVALKHGAALVLIGEEAGKDPQNLARLIAAERISIWYSAPSILALLAQFGKLARDNYPHLRTVLFAGEVFAVKHLRTLCELLPDPRYYNLYGPTETNVCTYYEVLPPVPPERTAPYPIGKVCSHLEGRVVDEYGAEVARGAEGELCISGRGVMQGYWALPEQSARGFFASADGRRWYRTGDIVVEAEDGNFTYRGRRDRMVKRRGYRVELGEIEAGLYRHPQVEEAAVVAVSDEEAGVKITAFLSCKEQRALSLIEIKRFCAENLPLYMIPDRFAWHAGLPKTSTDKIDYQRLKEMA